MTKKRILKSKTLNEKNIISFFDEVTGVNEKKETDPDLYLDIKDIEDPETKQIYHKQLNIDKIKERCDFLKLLGHLGIKIKRIGKNNMALCPFHDDTNPSLSINGKIFKCFGCGKSGDVIKFVEYYKAMKFKDALRFVDDFNNTTDLDLHIDDIDKVDIEPKKQKDQEDRKITVPEITLTKIAEHYHNKLLENNLAQKYLEKRGIKNKELIKRLKIGFSDGSILNILSKKQIDSLKKYGLLRENNTETFNNCIVFPIFNENEEVVHFYARNINDNVKIKHLYLKGSHKSVFNFKAVKTYSDRIILTESIIDALSLMQLGINNVWACYGTNGFTNEMLEILKTYRVKEIVIAFDNDEAGIKAAEKLKQRLIGEGFEVKIIFPPQCESDLISENQCYKDWNEELLDGITENEIKDLIMESEIHSVSDNQDEELKILEKNKHEIIIQIENRTYQLTRFKLNVLNNFNMTLKIKIHKKFFLSEVNLSKSSARISFISDAKEVLCLSEEILKDDLFMIMERMEELQREYIKQKESESNYVRVYEISIDEELEAKKILSSYDVLTNDLIKDTDLMGYTGETINKYAWYLAITSRKLQEPLNILSLGQSGGGKSYGQETLLKFVPDQDLKRYSKITPKALFYYGRYGLQNNVVAIDEIEGIEDAMYAIRTFLSNGYLTSSYPRIDPKTGNLTTFEKRVEGPITCFLSCTNLDSVDFETKNRFLITGNDESEAQTARIMQLQYEMMIKNKAHLKNIRSKIIKKYKNIQKVLDAIEVRMPEKWLSYIKFNGKRVGTRRLNKKYISMIQAITTHRQFLYEIIEEKLDNETLKRYVFMHKEDIELANTICKELFANTTNDLLPPVRTLLISLRTYCENKSEETELRLEEVTFTKSEAMHASKMSEWQVRHYMRDLINLEYVTAIKGRFGQKYVYKFINTDKLMFESDFEFIDPNILP